MSIVEALKLRLDNTSFCLHPSSHSLQEDLTLFTMQSLVLQLRIKSCSVCGVGREGLSGPAVLWFVCSVVNSPITAPGPCLFSLPTGPKLGASLGEDPGWRLHTRMFWLVHYSALLHQYGPICSLTPRNLSKSLKFLLWTFYLFSGF